MTATISRIFEGAAVAKGTSKETKKEASKTTSFKKWSLLRKTIEMLTFFAFLLTIDHTLLSGQAFDGLTPNPYWLPVLLMSVSYGSGMGLASAILATIIWVTAPHRTIHGDHLQTMLELSVQPMLWLIVALGVGEVTLQRIKRIEKLTRRRRELKEQTKKFIQIIDRVTKINRKLQVRIATEDHNVGEAIESLVDLLDIDQSVRVKAIERFISLATQTDNFGYYEVTGQQCFIRFRGHGASDWDDELSWQDFRKLLQPASQAPDKFAVSSLLEAPLTKAVPVYQNGKEYLVGLLVVESVPPSHLTDQKLFELERIAQSLNTLCQHLTIGLKTSEAPFLMTREQIA